MDCKKIIFISLILCSSKIYSQVICEGLKIIPTVSFNQCKANPWLLIFEDNFNGNSLDLSKWAFGPRIRFCNDEQQYYTNGQNVEISNGVLKLIAKKETVYAKADDGVADNVNLYCNGVDRGVNKRYFYYTSANIETINKFSFGKYEARIKIANGKGFWPAFWMFGGDPVYNEIDVFEFWNEKNIFGNYDPTKSTKVHNMNIHFDYYGNGSKSSCATYYDGVDFSQDFHVFTLIWERDKIQWFVDGSIKRTDYRYYTILGQSTGCQINAWTPYIMNRIYTKDSMQIILNFAIQNGNNSPLNSTIFPSQMEIDYVKYYQRDPAQDVSIPVINTLTPENQIYSPLMINDDYIKGGISNEGHDSLFLNYSLNNSIFNQKDQELHESKTFVDENIYVFPNPNSGSINVDFNLLNYKIYDIYVIDINGKTINSINGLNSSVISIDLSSCKKGAYYLYIINNQDKNIITHKIILQ